MGPISVLDGVVRSFGASGIVYRETEIQRMNFETVITEFLTGQLNGPACLVTFNTFEHRFEASGRANVARMPIAFAQ